MKLYHDIYATNIEEIEWESCSFPVQEVVPDNGGVYNFTSQVEGQKSVLYVNTAPSGLGVTLSACCSFHQEDSNSNPSHFLGLYDKPVLRFEYAEMNEEASKSVEQKLIASFMPFYNREFKFELSGDDEPAFNN